MAERIRRQGRAKGTGELFKNTTGGPWVARWYAHDGTRPERTTHTTDRATAERILAKYMADAALRRDGVIDATQDRHASESRVAIADHVAAYLSHCERIGIDGEHLASKKRHLTRMAEVAGIVRLGELTADALERYLSSIKNTGLSARTVNFARQIAVAFMGWAVKTGRVGSNPLKIVPKQDETRDRRRVRRPLTDDELSRLLSVARERGRDAWYLAAAMAGLRKGDMQQLTWGDVDFKAGTITIRTGKAKRTDTIPMHPQLADALRRRLDAFPAMPTARVWSDTVGNITRLNDFLRAGIASRVAVLDKAGKPVMLGEDGEKKPKMRIVVEDDQGRVIDLHALRTTLGTQLARAGVAPQVAQRIMRHSDYKTTLKHYTVLGLTDTAAAVAKLPSIAGRGREALKATGTNDAVEHPPVVPLLKRETGQNRAAWRGGAAMESAEITNEKPQQKPGFMRDSEGISEMERTRLELVTPSLQS